MLILLAWTWNLLAAPIPLFYSQQFLLDTNSGRMPADVIVGSDDRLYMVTQLGGGENHGTIFRINKDGTGLTVLRNVPSNHVYAVGPLMEGSDGVFYGTSQYGGSNGFGSIFRLNRDGSDFRILCHFDNAAGHPYYPVARLVEGPDGALYGTTRSGGSAGYSGTAYKLNKDGGGLQTLHSFGSISGDGSNPNAPLVIGSDGLLYGTTPYGGTNTGGTVFRMDTSGGAYEILHHFSPRNGDGDIPDCLLEASDHKLYGSTGYGGSTNCGAVFRLNRDGTDYAVIWSFTNCAPGGNYPMVHLVEGSDGSLYGTTGQCGAGYGSIFRLAMDGSSYAELWRFRAEPGDGQWPTTAPLQTSDSSFYGFTALPGSGAIYRLGPAQHLVSASLANDGFQLRCGGTPGQVYELQRTWDFSNWTPVSSFVAPLNPFLVTTDTNSPEGRAFYRLYAPPPK